ncbi:glycoside hydrolase family 43 protein [Humibacter albus]|uniref:glycoside hydrolase family 43 protein n=1 Tax=Humibacter albus TaxID=427754 RepID=UPI0003B61AB7|nr:glycoside hydrolase family 43 protein [Humibacter albus]
MTGSISPRTFTNPVIPGFHPDPSICRVGDQFYLVVSSFEYFPGIPIFTSTDLVSWTPLGHVLDRPSQLDLSSAPPSGGIYAPTIRHHNGHFFVTATNVSGGGHFIVHAEDPAGPWSEPVWVDQNGIDPSLFFDRGHVYFTSNIEPRPEGPHIENPDFVRGIQQSLVDPFTGRLLAAPQFIWGGTGGRYPEAPHMYRRGEYYYLVLAEGGTEYGHMVTIGRSSSPWGPFEASPWGPLVSHRSVASPLQAVGHADLFTLPNGEWWLVALGIRPVGQWPRHLLGRETVLAPVRWRDDDWPEAGDQGEIKVEQPRPALAAEPRVEHNARDDFDLQTLAPKWQFVRRPLEVDEVCGARPGWLTLVATKSALDGLYPCFIGRRQQHYSFVARTRIEYRPEQQDEEAGIAVRMNETHFFALAIRRHAEGVEATLRQRVGALEVCADVAVLQGSDFVLRVVGDDDHYRFSIEGCDGLVHTAASVDARFLTTEFAGGFTGVFVGPYAASPAGRSSPAYVDWFDYLPEPDGKANESSARTIEKTTAFVGRN